MNDKVIIRRHGNFFYITADFGLEGLILTGYKGDYIYHRLYSYDFLKKIYGKITFKKLVDHFENEVNTNYFKMLDISGSMFNP